MLKYFKALWYFVTGRFAAATAALRENQYVMAATYDKAIEKTGSRFTTIRTAVSNLITIETNRKTEIKEIGKEVDLLTKVKQGAQIAMQKRLDALKKEGKTKEQILADVEFLKHQAAYTDASSTLDEKLARMADKEKDLAQRQREIAAYKVELQGIQRKTEALKEEKEEALADVAVAQESQAVNDMLLGMSQDDTDKELAEARKARQRAVARSTVTAELAGNDAKAATNEYLSYAQASSSNKELDNLLNWGDTASEKKDLDPAKLPE